MAFSGYQAQLLAAGSPVSFSEEAGSTNDYQKFVITDDQKNIFDHQAELTVEESKDGSSWTLSDSASYTVNRLEGSVTFLKPRETNISIRFSGSYLPLSKAGQSYEYTYTIEVENQEVPEFGAAYQKRAKGLTSVSGEIANWYNTNSLLGTALQESKIVVIQFKSIDAAAPDLSLWATISASEVASTADGIVEESIEFEGTTDSDGRMFNFG